MAGWKLKRTIDGVEKPDFVFGDSVVLKSSEKLKVT